MKNAIVTGAEQGIGSGFVEVLLEKGWRVFGTTRKDPSELPVHDNLTWVPLDLCEDASIKKAYEHIAAETSTLDLLINNAGINKDTATNGQKEKVGTLGHLERAPLLNMFEVNTVAPVLMVQTFLPLLKTAEQAFIINLSSCRASFHDEFENEFGNYGYRASKIALNMMTHCLLKDLPENLKTFSVHPGTVRSQMNPSGADVPKTQAEKMLSIMENWDDNWNGKYMRYDGTEYPL